MSLLTITSYTNAIYILNSEKLYLSAKKLGKAYHFKPVGGLEVKLTSLAP